MVGEIGLGRSGFVAGTCGACGHPTFSKGQVSKHRCKKKDIRKKVEEGPDRPVIHRRK